MSRVIINEADRTTPVLTLDTTDVVFVPGFVNPNNITDDTAKQGEPILCESLADFVKYFGSEAPVFNGNQQIPSVFSADATEGLGTNVMFNDGAVDPSYVYAKELLSQGIPVVYERMNVGAGDLTVASAYSYLAASVFAASRSDVIVYPTLEAWSGTSAYSVGDIVGYVPAETPGAGTGLGPDGTTNYYNTDTAKAYLCMVAVAEPASGETNDGPDGDQQSAVWQELDRYQDTNNPLTDLGLSVKYITSGGYPTHETDIEGMMISLASTRGDCVALIDYLDNPNRKFVGEGSIFESVGSVSNGEYSAMFAPWIEVSKFNNSYTGTSSKHMPPSFAYLSALANSLKYYSNTNAVAGVNRGQIPNLKALCSNYILTNTIAEDAFQPDNGSSINGITNIRSYGYRIWGNRTLKPNSGGTTATSFLNIRNMVSDIKKVVYQAAMVTLFEPNAQITWINFTSKITPFLDSLVSNYGISKYQIDRNMTTSEGLPLPRTEMSATITIYPVYSIEKITITIAIRDDDTVDVSE